MLLPAFQLVEWFMLFAFACRLCSMLPAFVHFLHCNTSMLSPWPHRHLLGLRLIVMRHSLLLQFLVFVSSLVEAWAMYKKRGKGYNPEELSPSKRLRENLADLFLSNDVCAERMQEVFQDSEAAGLPGFRRLASAGGGNKKNIHRDLLKAVLHGCPWPALCHVDVPTWCPRTKKMLVSKIPFMLPHEVVRCVWDRSTPEELLKGSGFSSVASSHLELWVGLWVAPSLVLGSGWMALPATGTGQNQ